MDLFLSKSRLKMPFSFEYLYHYESMTKTDCIKRRHYIPLMIINTEWGGFSKVLPQTIFDQEMDAESPNRGEHLYEKMVSGMYLGEIVRRVLLQMCETSDLFGQFVPGGNLSKPFALKTEHLNKMQEDTTDDLQTVGLVLYNILEVEANLQERRRVVEVCDTVVKRGGRLAGAGVNARIKQVRKWDL
ncbi:hexokinase [Arabidopsis thaliana]|uniref:Phosphotransferase n=1 Tax=Arabidopsis thaliana TaxID=3702 RepID=A0A1P8ARU2_ARATH|nr:hexokinase [Arabidopsis thaliana]ANM59364.1 hexokinase [Arabidopsis thaliana]|eukprot:NP_001321727.1 hexokinase [Arabidopsis thaliana]